MQRKLICLLILGVLAGCVSAQKKDPEEGGTEAFLGNVMRLYGVAKAPKPMTAHVAASNHKMIGTR